MRVANPWTADRVAKPRAADRPAGGWTPEGRIDIDPLTAPYLLSI
jgi:hypothetical protein